MSPNAPRVAPRGDVALMHGYHSPQLEVDVRLNTNEAPGSPPDAWRQALADELATVDWHRYPDRAAIRLRDAIARHQHVDPGQVFAANGSNEVLQTLCLTYGGAGRTVLTFEPTYALHAHIARITGTGVVEGERDERFALDSPTVCGLVAEVRPTITFLCSPNNPTGMLESEQVVRDALDVVTAVGGLLVVDEAYGQFAPWSALELVDDERPLVVTRTFSKTWSMAAARLGYLVGPTWVVEEMEKVVLPYHLDVVTQAAGALALEFEAEMKERVASVVEERGRVFAALSELPVEVWPSDASFILFRPTDREGGEVWRELVDRSVLVRDCSSWPRLDGCLRVTIGTTEEDDAFLAALEEIL